MRRFIDRYLESKGLQTFAYLWDGVEQALKEAQYDTNAQSIRDDLRRGPVVKKDPKDPKALPAAKGSQDFKGPKGAKGPGKDKGKEGKSQNEAKGKGFDQRPILRFRSRSSVLTPKVNAKEELNAPILTRTLQARLLAKPLPVRPRRLQKSAKAAAMVALLGAVGAPQVTGAAIQGGLDFVADTGAGECLGSPEALKCCSSFFLLYPNCVTVDVQHWWRFPKRFRNVGFLGF